MSWAFHMALTCGGTAVEILVDQFLADVWASVEEAASHHFEEG
jgi:hypothetical protein